MYTTPTDAALACARRFLDIESKHSTTHKGRWAMFDAALAKYRVDEFEVEEALEYLAEQAAESDREPLEDDEDE